MTSSFCPVVEGVGTVPPAPETVATVRLPEERMEARVLAMLVASAVFDDPVYVVEIELPLAPGTVKVAIQGLRSAFWTGAAAKL
jgi:hypothetical protein